MNPNATARPRRISWQATRSASLAGVLILLAGLSIPMLAIGKNISVLATNFIKLTLLFTTTPGASWSPDHVPCPPTNFVFNPSAQIGVVTECLTIESMVVPYEGKVTAAPTNSYGPVTNYGVSELGYITNTITTISGVTTNASGIWAPGFTSNTYIPPDDDVTTTGTMANPVMYMFDSPGVDESYAAFSASTNILKVTAHIVLASTPVYQGTNSIFYSAGSTKHLVTNVYCTYWTNSIGPSPTNCWDTQPHWSSDITNY